MTEQPKTTIGTVAEEAARLIEDMATRTRARSCRSQEPGPYAGRPAQQPASPDVPPAAPAADGPAAPSATGACTCGGRRDGTPVACALCPLCQGIALLRSLRPETMDRLADLASAVTDALRDVAAQARASGPSTTWPASGSPFDRGRDTQDIAVVDESEG